MGVCILGMGDCGSKSDNKSVTNIKNINQTMTNMVTSTSQSIKATQITVQSVRIEVGGDMDDCPLSVSQKMIANQTINLTLDLKDTTSLKNQITTALKTENETAQKNKTEFLATASTSANNYTEVNQVVENLVSTNKVDELRVELNAFMSSLQEGVLIVKGNLKCRGRPIVFSQDMVTKQVVDMITKKITGTTLENVLETQVENVNKTKQEGESGGATGLVTGVLDSIGGIISGPFKYIGIAIVAIVLLGIIAKMIMSKRTPASFGRRRRR
jgi:hypothetical protein